VAYYRVSTQRQGRSGLGQEGQREAVAAFLRTSLARLLAEFTEIESRKRDDRPSSIGRSAGRRSQVLGL
jgi:DNA invertase Pin-like site-specific DNA recombinase